MLCVPLKIFLGNAFTVKQPGQRLCCTALQLGLSVHAQQTSYLPLVGAAWEKLG